MYCPNCGGANADGYNNCTHCGARLPADHYSPSRVESLARIRPTAHTNTLADREAAVYGQMRRICTSPTFIAALICYGTMVLLQLISISNNNILGQMGYYLDDMGIDSDMVFGSSLDFLSGAQFISMIPSILIAVGLLVTLISAMSYNGTGRITSAGLSIILVLQIISLVMLGIVSLIALFAILALLGSESDAAFMLALILIGVLAFTITYNVFVLKSISAAKNTLDTGLADSGVSSFVGVMCYIGGGFSVLMAVGWLISGYLDLASFLSGIAMVLFGVLIFEYKSIMEALEAMNYPSFFGTDSSPYSAAPSYRSSAPRADTYIPTWKRIEMEEQNKQ